jgi:heptosyltransferase-2
MRLSKTERSFKKALIWLFAKLLADKEYGPEQIDPASVKSVLVVRQHDQLGDLILSTPVFRALRSRFPQARITAVARVYTSSVLLNNPNIDQVLVYPEKLRFATPVRVIRLVRGLQQGYDLAVVINTVSHSLSSDLVALFSGAKYRLGSAERPFYDFRANLFYNLISPAPPEPVHESARSLATVAYLGAVTDDLSEEVALAPEEVRQGQKSLWDRHLVPEKTIGIHLGAANLENRWPYQKYARLAEWLNADYGFQIAVFWGAKEQELGERFLGEVKCTVHPVNGLDIRQVAAVLRHLRLVITNDTGIMHLSAAVGGNTFSIFGRSDPELWRPLNKGFYGVRGPDKTRASAELEVVQSGIRRMLERME